MLGRRSSEARFATTSDGVRHARGVALGIRLRHQCGAKLFKATPALKSAFERPFSLRWSFDVEFLGRLLERQATVGDIDVKNQCAEVPLEEWADAPGSKLTAAAVPRIALELATLLVTARAARFTKPKA
jgi:hypothetical protein